MRNGKKEWTLEKLATAYKSLVIQCQDHSLAAQPHKYSWSQVVHVEKVDQLQHLLADNGIAPIVPLQHQGAAPEETNPAASGELLALSILESNTTLAHLTTEGHLSKNMVKALLRRLYQKHPEVIDEVKTLNTRQLIDAFEEKIAMALQYIDHVSLAKSSFKDITVGIGVMIDKMRLLQGEPTQILSIEERVNLQVLLPQLISEGRRRGVTIEQQPD